MNLLLLERQDLFDAAGRSASECGKLPRFEAEGSSGAHRCAVPPTLWSARLEGEQARHVVKVLGAQCGDRLRVGVVDGPLGDALVQSVAKQEAGGWQVQVRVSLNRPPPPPLEATLVLALPRPKFLGRILQWASTMGVKRIVLTHSARVEKSYWHSSLMQPASLRRHLELGLEQGRDTVLPQLHRCASFDALVQGQLSRAAQEQPVWVAHAEAAEALPDRIALPATLCIGPEGGWVERELEVFQSLGATAAHVGQRPLRVEAAVAVVLGRCLGAA